MNAIKATALACIFFAAAANADGMKAAPSLSVGGFTIGGGLPHECGASKPGAPNPSDDQTPCITRDASVLGAKTRLHFHGDMAGTNGQHPAEAIIVDGKLEGVRIFTNGVDSQREWLTDLTNKYGKPLELADVPTQNRMGATFSVIRAGWVFSDLVVTFDGALKQIDLGVVTIETRKAMAAEEAAKTPSSL